MSDLMQGLVLGCLLGFILGYLTNHLRNIERGLNDVKEDLGEFDACVRKCKEDHVHVPPRNKKNESGFMRKPLVADVAYLFALLLILIGLWQINGLIKDLSENAQQDLVARCEGGEESRSVQRKLVDGIYNLAIGSIERDEDAPPLTKQELMLYNAYITRVNDFRADLYKQIAPSEQCEPYVEDDVVPPPTPPHPPIVNGVTQDDRQP